MAYKKYGFEQFHGTAAGVDYLFYCHAENTRYGFRHVCDVRRAGVQDMHASCAYYNRTWERFTYESVLKKVIAYYPAAIAAELHAQIIDRTARAEDERCGAEFSAFKALYDQQTPGMKRALANVTLNDEKDVQVVTGIMKAATILNGIK